MITRRIPDVQSTAANTLTVLLHVLGGALMVADAPGWGLYLIICGQVVHWSAVLHEYVHRTYPHEEQP